MQTLIQKTVQELVEEGFNEETAWNVADDMIARHAAFDYDLTDEDYE